MNLFFKKIVIIKALISDIHIKNIVTKVVIVK